MSDQTQANASATPQDDAGVVLSTIANAVSSSLTALGHRTESANIALMSFTVMFAAMPEIAALRPERLAAVMGVILQKGDDKMKKDVADYITAMVNMAQEVPKALAAAEAAYAADQKAKGAVIN